MRIAFLEDDPVQSKAITTWLAAAGHGVSPVGSVREFTQARGRESFDLYLIDWMLPDGDGFQVLQWLRREQGETAPIVFTTSRDAEEDIVAALNAGADDYLVKPVRRLELLSRLEAVARRHYPAAKQDVFAVPPYRFELAGHRVLRGDEPLTDLTEKEFQLALFLFRNLGRLLSRNHLLEAVWGLKQAIPTRTLDTHVSRVRRKLDLHPANGFRLTPAYSFGYRLERTSGDGAAAVR